MEVTEWGELLKPWLSALRRAELRQPDLPALPKVSDVHKTWFHVSAPHGDRNNARVWRLLGEAMQLVDLLARVDNKAAWYLMLGLVDRSAMALQYAELLFASTEEPILPKFVIEIVEIVLADKDEGHNIRQGIMRMLVKNEMPPSANFEKMKQILLDKWARAHFGEVFSREKRGRVRASLHVQVDMQLEDEDDVRNLFRHLKTLAVAQADQSTTVLDECGNDMDCNDDGEEDVGIDENDEDDDDSDDNEEDEDPEHPEEHPEEDEADEDEEESACGEAIDYTEEDDGTEENISDHEDTSSTTIIPRVRGSIELVSFRILILSNSPVTNLVLRYINKIAATGIRISHFTFATVHHTKLHAHTIDEFMQKQFQLCGDTRDDSGVEDLAIEAFKFDIDGVRVLSTAIAHSQSLRTLSFAGAFSEIGDSTDRDMWWVWLAYALFSRDSRHNIKSVSLSVEALLPSCVSQIQEVLTHNRPLALLYGETDTDTDPPTSTGVQLGASAVIQRGSQHDGKNVSTILRNKRSGLCQLDQNSPEEGAVEFVESTQQRLQHSIRSLNLKFVEAKSVPAVVDFLHLIGDPIEHLKLDFTTDTFDNAIMAAIVACCPNLKRIDLCYLSIDSFNWLETWCSDRPLKLEMLCLEGVSTKDRLQWCSLFENLARPSSALTKSLRRLHINSFRVRTQDAQDTLQDQAEIVESCLRMLDANVLIDHFELLQLDQRLLTTYQERILSHNGDLLAVERAPLSSRTKLAFLSVLRSNEPAEPLQKQVRLSICASSQLVAPYNVDPDALRRILAFAAKPKRRICAVY